MEMKAFSIYDEQTGASARIAEYGATVISWKVQNHERLFLSTKAHLDGSKAIRGGIPLVFPVFGKANEGPCAKLPQHGFARTSYWQIVNKQGNEATLSLKSADLNTEARSAWSSEFELLYTVKVTANQLLTSLQVKNTDSKDFEFQTLLHSYFRVKNIANVSVEGLDGVTYKDKVSASEIKETAAQVGITQETDRVYPRVQGDVTILENGKPSFQVKRKNLEDVVLWNPWTGCSKMADFGPEDGYQQMVCVEAGAVSRWHTLGAGESFTASQTVTAML
ncbi:galactose mutarotase-like domain-containing protein [Protomyces lactucae-debilis]|uniref:Glucose-6-phosphate 1-epimerase n=1 Tax=Protomyces lactucae-debilis TaxID=2754530 RepID=A0A1Y2FV47_PROLT|nr:galactose mutarotase-like domain-containing protein [Protomyces lactucae-debilis]ORY87881.1 galactose mutarotase-like domain-containing protein [Protomyces lactucae-debilis]